MKLNQDGFFVQLEPDGFGLCSLTTGAIVGGANLLGNLWGSSTAAGAQTQASQAAIQNQQQMFAKLQGLAQPYIGAGSNALSSIQGLANTSDPNSPFSQLLKLVTPGADQTATLEQTPGYQFTQSQGLRGINNALAARGLGGSGGAVARGVGQYTTGLAQNTWQSVVQNLLSSLTGGAGVLQGVANTGANALGGLTGAGTSTANQVSSSLTGIGNAQGAAATSIGNSIGSTATGIGNNYMLSQLIGQSQGVGGGSPSGGAWSGGGSVFGG